MKRLVVIVLAFACLFPASMAQVKSLKAAKKYLNQEKYSDAASLIEDVVVNEETALMPDAWILRSKIYIAISHNPLLGRQFPNAAELAMESVEKVFSLDPQKAPLLMGSELNAMVGIFMNNGNAKFEAKDYAGAVTDYEKGMKMENYKMMPNEDNIYNFTFNLALSAMNAGMLEKAEEAFKTVIDSSAGPDTYVRLVQVYIQVENFDEASKWVEEMRSTFPEEKSVGLNSALFYLQMNKKEDALQVLEQAVAKWSDDPVLYQLIGYTCSETDFEKSEEAYKKALEINPEYTDAILNMAALYVNRGIQIKEEANNLPLEAEAKYAELDAQAKDLFNKALPYLLKLVELQPQNVNAITTLRDVYMQLGQAENAKQWGDKVKELE